MTIYTLASLSQIRCHLPMSVKNNDRCVCYEIFALLQISESNLKYKSASVCLLLAVYRVSKKTRAACERLLVPEYISNDLLQYLIE